MHSPIVYILNGRSYTTVNGLSKAIFKDSGCSSHSMVRVIEGERVILAFNRDKDVIARYSVSAPKAGEPMQVKRIRPIVPEGAGLCADGKYRMADEGLPALMRRQAE